MSTDRQSSEKYFKKLVGRTDLEDALKRLDKLTQEEARMATAEVLKAMHAVDGRVRGVAEQVVGVDDRVAGIDDRVVSVNNRLRDVSDLVNSVNDSVRAVDDKVTGVVDGAQTILSRSADKH